MSIRSSDGSKANSTQRTRVDGVRRVWGTLRITTVAVVKSTLKKLSPAASNSIVVKRKVREYGDSNKTRWWFILRGDENTLKMLEGDWERIQMLTNWKLEHCIYRPKPLDPYY